MRRETDFVFEKAAWPTMLLEPSGRICRANQAARRVFGLPNDPGSSRLTAFWDDENKASADNFLQQQTEGETAQLKLRLQDGKKTQFVAHVAKVVREGQDYFVLQLFKESGSSFAELAYAPAPKAEAAPAAVGTDKPPISLMEAGWPAIFADAQGKIVHVNPAAAAAFGAKAAAPGAPLAGICPPDEAGNVTKLLHQPDHTPTSLKACRADGAVAPFRVESYAAPESKWVVLQFFAGGETARPKDDDFLLQNAEWPVLLVHRSKKVLRANRAAVRAFGASIEQDDAQLEAIWSPHNKESCQQFLNLPPSAEPLPLKFHLKSGMSEDYWGQLCNTADPDVFLLQLLKGSAPAAASSSQSAAAPAAAPSSTPASAVPAGAPAAAGI